MTVEVLNETEWSVDEARLVRLIDFCLESLHVHPDAEACIVIVDVPAMEQLHVQWMDEPGPTDVMSFPMDELRPGTDARVTPPGLLGDIVLCPAVANDQATQQGRSLQDELDLLTCHGLLHLLGFDHAEPHDEREMFGIQDHLLLTFARAERA